MILPMSKVRILGPREGLAEVLPFLQDFGQLHLTSPKESADVSPLRQEPADELRERHLVRVRHAVHAALEALGQEPVSTGRVPEEFDRATLSRWARLARAVRSEVTALSEKKRTLEEERAFLGRFRQFFGSFQALAEAAAQWPGAAAYHVILPAGGEGALLRLEEGLRAMLGEDFEIWSQELDTGETGVLIMAPKTSEGRLEELFRASRVEEVELPGMDEGLTPAETMPRIVARFDAIPKAVAAVEESLARLGRRHRRTLEDAEAATADALARIQAVERAGSTDHAFVIEGWLPRSQRQVLERALQKALGSTTVVEEISREEWVGEDVPVVLHNPRIFNA